VRQLLTLRFGGHGFSSAMRHALCDFSSALVGGAMPAIASLEDLKAAQKDLLEAKDLNELETVFKNGAG